MAKVVTFESHVKFPSKMIYKKYNFKYLKKSSEISEDFYLFDFRSFILYITAIIPSIGPAIP